MPHYIPAMLHRFQHPKPNKYQGAPHSWTTPIYGAKVQFATSADASPLLPESEITAIQRRVGTILYYAVAVDPLMLTAPGTIGSSQSKLTKAECLWLMDYAACHPLSILRYTASGMTLYVHSDASYLSETDARSRAAGHFFLSSPPIDPDTPRPNCPHSMVPFKLCARSLTSWSDRPPRPK
jgi:hypothetical protein